MDDILTDVVIIVIILLFLGILVLILFTTGAQGKIFDVWIDGKDIIGQIWHTIMNTINDSRMAT